METTTTTNGNNNFLSMGRDTFKVSLTHVFAANRQKLISSLHDLGFQEGLIYLKGGTYETRFDSDHEPLFRQESYFWYLSGVKEPDCSLIIDLATSSFTMIIPKVPADYATIMGKIKSKNEWAQIYQADHVIYEEETDDFLKSKTATSEEGRLRILLMQGPNSDSGNMYEPPPNIIDRYGMDEQFLVDTITLFPVLAECRVIKSAAERSFLQHVTEVTSFAHAYVMRNMRPDMMEYQGESLFRHYCYYNYGCRLVGYTPICGCGPNAAILHYGHAGEPNARQIKNGDMCLFDMGAEYFGYGSDVTCSFPVNGKFTEQQAPIYEAVLNAQKVVYDMIKPGVSWVQCHKAAETEILKGLEKIGIVVLGEKSIQDLVDGRLGAIFMPHGLGHFIGIDTHDVGGYLPGHPERIPLSGLKSLRTSRILETNMTLTVEPGLYFIDHLLDSALSSDSPLRQHLNAEKVAAYRGFGGVRLEDVVLVTEDGCVNYTLCPRTIQEVEAVMAGAKWPPMKDEAPELRRIRLTDPTPLPPPPSL